MRPFQQKKFIFQAMGASILLSALPFLASYLCAALIDSISSSNNYNGFYFSLGLICPTFPSLLGIPAMIVLSIIWISSFLTIRGIAIIILGALWIAYFIYIGQIHEKIEEKFFNEE